MSDATALREALERLCKQEGFETLRDQTFLLLARYKRDIERVGRGTEGCRIVGDSTLIWTNQAGKSLELQFKTMHAAKGLTCDYAFILNANGGAYGIPAERSEDPVVSMLLAEPDMYAHAEERRLFYVAMTRAKRSTTLIATTDNPSPFVQELGLTGASPKENVQHCPACESGILLLRNGTYGSFYGCSNYAFGCTFSQNVRQATAKAY